MTTYRLWPSTNGGALVSYGPGNFIAAVQFAVKGGGNWLTGYHWWVPSGGDTGPVKCALWSVAVPSGGGGTVVPGSTVTSGTLTASAWNFIPLASPLQLAPGWDTNSSTSGSIYQAQIGWSASNGFPDTNGYWGSGGAGQAGISNGPLLAYSGSSGTASLLPYTAPSQGLFSVAGTDPAAVFAGSTSGVDNFWVDVEVSDTAPAGYSGSYRLWPNKWDANAGTTGDAAVNYTVATEFSLSAACTLNNIWYFSPAAATTLATRADVWRVSDGANMASVTSPSWKTIAGSSATAGVSGGAMGQWLRAAPSAGVTLPAGDYRVSVYNSAGSTDSAWSAKDAGTDYWGQTLTGAGSGGITNGPLSAPGYAGASAGFKFGGAGTDTPPWSTGGTAAPHAQSVFYEPPANTGAAGFPQLYAAVGGSSNQTQNYWVDVEVTPLAVSSAASEIPLVPPGMLSPMGLAFAPLRLARVPLPDPTPQAVVLPGAASLSGSGSVSAAGTVTSPASLSGTGSVISAAAVTAPGGMSGSGTLASAGTAAGPAGLSGSGSLSASAGVTAPAGLSGTGSLSAAGTVTVTGAAVLSGSGSVTAAETVSALAALSGSGSLAGAPSVAAPAALSGSGSASAPAAVNAPAALSGSGSLSASASGTVTGTASLSGSGSAAAAAAIPAAAVLSGTGSAAAGAPVPAPAGLSGSGTLAAGVTVTAAGRLSGAGSVSANAGGNVTGTAALDGSGSLGAASSVTTAAGLSGSGSVSTGPAVTAPASLSGSGSLAAAGVTQPAALLTGSGSVSAAAQVTAPAALDGSGTVTASPSGTATGSAALSGSGSLTVAAVIPGPAALSGSGALAAAASSGAQGAAVLSGSGAVAALAAVAAAESLSGLGTLLASAGGTIAGAAVLSGSGSLTTGAGRVLDEALLGGTIAALHTYSGTAAAAAVYSGSIS